MTGPTSVREMGHDLARAYAAAAVWLDRRRGRYAFRNRFHVRLVRHLRERNIRWPHHLLDLDDRTVLQDVRAAVLRRRIGIERGNRVAAWIAGLAMVAMVATDWAVLAHLHVEPSSALMGTFFAVTVLGIPTLLAEPISGRGSNLVMTGGILGLVTLTGLALSRLGAGSAPGRRLPEHPDEFKRQLCVTILCVLTVLVAAAVLAATLAVLVEGLGRRAELRRYPLAVALDELLHLIDHTRVGFGGRTQTALRRLERTAVALQAHVTSFDVGDEHTRRWAQAQGRAVAWRLRSLKPWVITPKADTAEQLRRSLELALVAVALNRLDELAGTDAAVPPDRARTAELVAGLRAVAAGALPLAAALVLGWRELLPPDLEGPAYLVTSLIAAVSVLAAIDPTFRDRISTVKDLYGYLDPSRGEDGPGRRP